MHACTYGKVFTFAESKEREREREREKACQPNYQKIRLLSNGLAGIVETSE